MADRAIETELTDHADVVECAGGQLLAGDQQSDRDSELETRTGLAHPTGCEVHRDARLRPREPRREQSCTHALT